MDPIYYLVLAAFTCLWRCAWLGFIVPVWRVGCKAVVILAGAWTVNRAEREAEEGAYQ